MTSVLIDPVVLKLAETLDFPFLTTFIPTLLKTTHIRSPSIYLTFLLNDTGGSAILPHKYRGSRTLFSSPSQFIILPSVIFFKQIYKLGDGVLECS